jgi:hypothetical protein
MEVWTHGEWVAKPGCEDEFVDAWSELAEWKRSRFSGAQGRLFRDLDRPNVFFSWSARESAEQVAEWRGARNSADGLGRYRSCSRASIRVSSRT